MFAAAKGHFYIVKYLVGKGADVNAKDNNGVSVLDYAIKLKKKKKIRFKQLIIEETPRHRVLGRLEFTSLVVEWWTMWSGLMIYQLSDGAIWGIVLTLSVILGNVFLFGMHL